MVLLQTWGWLTGKNQYYANYLTMQARRLTSLGAWVEDLCSCGDHDRPRVPLSADDWSEMHSESRDMHISPLALLGCFISFG